MQPIHHIYHIHPIHHIHYIRCIPTYLPTYCLPACLPACLSVCLPACLPNCLPACMHAHILQHTDNILQHTYGQTICIPLAGDQQSLLPGFSPTWPGKGSWRWKPGHASPVEFWKRDATVKSTVNIGIQLGLFENRLYLLVLNVGNGWESGNGSLLIVSQWIIPSPMFSTSKYILQRTIFMGNIWEKPIGIRGILFADTPNNQKWSSNQRNNIIYH